jgi:shikimate kinase
MNLVFVGYRACGKTSVGKRLAERINWPFADTDEIIQDRAGMAIAEIFAREGEIGFREREREVVAELSHDGPIVLSVGGGAIVDSASVEALKKTGKLVWLQASAEVLFDRLNRDETRKSGRPSRTDSTSPEDIENLLAQRRPYYCEAADAAIDVTDKTVDEAAEAVRQWALEVGIL